MKWFTEANFACQCGCGKLPQKVIMDLADQVRDEYGHPLYVDSGARCDKHTAELRAQGIPAALHSAHNEGLAVDLRAQDMVDFHKFCLAELVRWNCWMEDPASTPNWSHLQKRPVPGKRVFKP